MFCITFVSRETDVQIKEKHVKNDTEMAAVTELESLKWPQENLTQHSVKKAGVLIKNPQNKTQHSGKKQQQVLIHRSAVFKKQTTAQILFPLKQYSHQSLTTVVQWRMTIVS